MITPPLRAVMYGSVLASWMVIGAGPGRLNAIVSRPSRPLASAIAARSVQRPRESAHTPLPGATSGVSSTLVTVNVRRLPPEMDDVEAAIEEAALRDGAVAGEEERAGVVVWSWSAFSAWTSATSTQPSPLTSPSRVGPQTFPVARAESHAP